MGLHSAGGRKSARAAAGVPLVQPTGAGSLFRQQHHASRSPQVTVRRPVCSLCTVAVCTLVWRCLLPLSEYCMCLKSECMCICIASSMQIELCALSACSQQTATVPLALRHSLCRSMSRYEAFCVVVCLEAYCYSLCTAPKSPCRGSFRPLLGNHGCV